MLCLIAAVGHGGVIGAGNALPWRLPADLRRFKAITLGRPVIMGRRTHESIGRALPGRRNIVLSRAAPPPLSGFAGCEMARSLSAAIELARQDGAGAVFVIGGGQIYAQAMPQAQRLHITEVDVAVENGDAFFPSIDPGQWRETSRETHAAKDGAPAHAFVTYERAR